MPDYGRQLVRALAGAAWYATVCVLGLAGLPSVASAQTPQCEIRLAWDEHPEDVAFFDLYSGTRSGNYSKMTRLPGEVMSDNFIKIKNTRATFTINQPSVDTTYYFALAAVSADLVASLRSDEVSVLFTRTCASPVDGRPPQMLNGVATVRILKG